MRTQRYAPNTIKSYTVYLKLFLNGMQKYDKLAHIPVEEIESFITSKVKYTQISSSYQRSLIGAIKKGLCAITR